MELSGDLLNDDVCDLGLKRASSKPGRHMVNPRGPSEPLIRLPVGLKFRSILFVLSQIPRLTEMYLNEEALKLHHRYAGKPF
jgi:hypothetical protein